MNIKPNAFANKMVKYGKDAEKLKLDGDIEGAINAKEKEVLNFILYKEAIKAKQKAESVAKMARKAGALVFRHGSNQGYGGALRTCFKIGKEEKADCLVIIDSDGQHDPDYIPSLVNPIKNKEADLVIGSRFKTKRSRKEIPIPPSPGKTDAIKLFSFSSSRSGSITVPGVIRRTTSRLTMPLAFLGSSNCSQMATFRP